MKYVVQVEITPDVGADIEEHPEEIQALLGKWQALKPLGMYMGLSRRAMTIIVDVPNEDAMFEALHATWITTNDYPEITPVVSIEEFPQLLQRAGIGH